MSEVFLKLLTAVYNNDWNIVYVIAIAIYAYIIAQDSQPLKYLVSSYAYFLGGWFNSNFHIIAETWDFPAKKLHGSVMINVTYI